jgi:outer membrane protein assembly factor BamB
MGTSILLRHAIVPLATGTALVGLFAVAGAAGATARTVPASHHGTARPAARGGRQQVTGFSNWPTFRGGTAHQGLSVKTMISTGNAGTLTALNLTTGKVIWQHALAKGTAGDVSGAALEGNTIYLGSDARVYALNATTGATRWHVLAKLAFYSSPAVDGPAGEQVLVIANITGHIYALNLATGATLWAQQPTTVGIWSSPAISRGTIFIASKDGVLRTFAPAAG